MLGKIVDGELFCAPKRILIDGKIIFNPSEEILRMQGYKYVENTEAPAVYTKTQKTVATWTEQEDKIVRVWEIKPSHPDPTIALQEAQKNIVLELVAESEDKTLGIKCMALFPTYVQDKQHTAGDVETHPETGYPWECMTSYDGTVQQDWTIDNRTLWKPWHSREPEYALPWVAPTGAHDMYKSGEYMIWTDGTIRHCLENTNFSPEEYPQAWEIYNAQ